MATRKRAKQRFDLPAWLQLVRLPNLLSVPGDPWAGLALAGLAHETSPAVWRFVLVAVVSLCIYAAGLVLNDLHDEPVDKERRPERPLPSGRIDRVVAARFCSSLMALGVVCALPLGRPALVTTALLVALVVAYNLPLKGHRVSASVCMGLCRGGSVLVGAAAADFGFAPLVAALGITVYIAAVTWIAAGENRTQTLDRILVVPVWAFAVAGGLVAAVTFWDVPFLAWLAGVGLLGWATHWVWRHGCELRRRPVPPERMQPAIGGYIRNQIAWQAGLIALGGVPLLGAALFALSPLARRLARRYAES